MNILEDLTEIFRLSLFDQRASSKPKAPPVRSNHPASPFNDRFAAPAPAPAAASSAQSPVTPAADAAMATQKQEFESSYRGEIPMNQPDPSGLSALNARVDTATVNAAWAGARTSIRGRTPVKTLTLTRRAALSKDTFIHDTTSAPTTSAPPVYFAKICEVKRKTPDVTLHRGPDTSGEVLGFSHFRYSTHFKVGIGSSEHSASIVWEDMRRTAAWYSTSKYEFGLDCHDPRDGTWLRRRRFSWHRTRAAEDGVEGLAGKMSIRNYRLTDLDSDEVLAVFLATNLGSLKKLGELHLLVELDQEVELVVVLTCMSIIENLSRD